VLKVYSSKSLLEAAYQKSMVGAPVATVSLRSPPHWLAVSSDNLTLAVCCSGDKGLQILFFDTRNLINTVSHTTTQDFLYLLYNIFNQGNVYSCY